MKELASKNFGHFNLQSTKKKAVQMHGLCL